MHLDNCKDRVIEEVRRYRFNEPIPGWHGDIRNPSHFGSEDIQRYEEAAEFDVRHPRPSRMSLITKPLPRGEYCRWISSKPFIQFANISDTRSTISSY